MDNEDRAHLRHCSEKLRIANDLLNHADAALNRADWDMIQARGSGLEMQDIINAVRVAQQRVEDKYQEVIGIMEGE